jgi:hypothetical protein
MTVIAIFHRYHESGLPTLSDIGITHISFDYLPNSKIGSSAHLEGHSQVFTVILRRQIIQSMTQDQRESHARDMLSATGLTLMNELFIRVRCSD